MIHPLWCIGGALLTFIGTGSFFAFCPHLIARHPFVTVYGMILFYTGYAVLTDRTHYEPHGWRRVLAKAAWKYLLWGFLLWTAVQLYRSHPLYQRFFPDALPFVEDFFRAYLPLGFLYMVLSERFRHSRANVLGDPVLRLLSLGKLLSAGRFRRALVRAGGDSYRSFLMGLLLRVHFLPIMLQQVAVANRALFTRMQDASDLLAPLAMIAFITSFALCVDNNNASMGYFWESNFTRTRFRRVDPFPLHWIVTLSCYTPFADLASMFLMSPMYPASGDLLIEGPAFKLVTDLAIMVFTVGYSLAGTSLAFSWSNLAYKQIQTRGLYGLIRHPGTFCKLSLFGVMIFRHRCSWEWWVIASWFAWMAVYCARTLCEERFLKTCPEYREYMNRVRWRVIPGIF